MHRRSDHVEEWQAEYPPLPYPGRPFTCKDLSRLLNNVVYIGKVKFWGQIYQGEHAGIIEEESWQKAQSMIEEGADRQGPGPLTPSPSSNPCHSDQQWSEGVLNRLPRITRLLALAMKFEGLIQQGVAKDYAELARLGQVSRARMTQIMNLLNLAPDIREQILFSLPGLAANQRIRESSIRKLSAEVIWSRQRKLWKNGPRSLPTRRHG